VQNLDAGPVDNSVIVCDDITDPVTLDPHYSFDNKTDNILNQLYEGLVELNEDGRLKACLAQSWYWEGNAIIFNLMPGVKFHNGEPFDAEAVAFSLNRLMSISSSPAGMQLGELGNIKVIGPYKVAIEVKKFKGRFLNSLAAFAKMVPPKYFAAHDDVYLREHPVGTGPFIFHRWDKGEKVILMANKNYWVKGTPKVESVVFHFVPYEKQIDLLIKGQLDLLSELPGTQTARIAGYSSLKVVKIKNFLTPVFWFVNFRGPLAKVEVRQAFNYAINKDQLIRYAVLGNGIAVASLSMSGEIGHADLLNHYSFDLNKARMFLAHADWPKDFVVRILTSQQAEREAKIISENLKQAGVKTQITVMGLAEMTDSIIKKRKLQEFDIYANLAPDPIGHSTFLAGVCFYSKSPLAGLQSREFDSLYEDILETREIAEQTEKGKKLDTLIHEQAWALFTYQRIKTYGMSLGLIFKPRITGMLDFNEVSWRKH